MGKQPASTPMPSQGKQTAISSFFTRKPPTSSLPAASSQTKPPQEPSKVPNLYNADSDDDEDLFVAPRRSSAKRPLADVSDEANGRNSTIELQAKRKKPEDNSESSSALFLAKPPVKPNTVSAKPIISPRTEKFVYTGSSQIASSDQAAIPEEEPTAAEKARKEEIHRQWVKRIGGIQIGRRYDDATPAPADGDGDEGEEEEEVPAPKAKKKGAKTGKLTPLELQVLDIKRKHMDTLLIVEVGYKFKFFGEDARVAAKELSIVCIPGKFRYDEHPSEAHYDRFASASIPVHRLPVHAKRLVTAGLKVGVVRQIETAALKKAGDNRNAPFTRKLTNVYTKGTYVDDIDSLDQPAEGAPSTGYLLCITESKVKGWGTDEKVEVGILAVQPSTGDIIYDTFEDGFMRSELETRLLHLAPCEFLIVGDLTKATDKLVKHLSGSSTNAFGDRIRVERVPKGKTMAAESHSHVTQFYADKLKAQENETEKQREQSLLDKVLKLPEQVTVCLSAMISHLTEYGLEHVFDLTKYFQSFSTRSHMILNGNTLTSLEVYQNQTDHTEKGSLFWTLDKTQTRFGQRLLRKWVGRPLLDKTQLEARVSAVEELNDGHQTPKVDKLHALLRNIRVDLERSLIRIYYGKCTRPELLTALQTLQRISNEYSYVRSAADAPFKSDLITAAIASLPSISETIISFLDQISAEAARQDDKYAFFHEDHETDAIADHKLGIAAVEQELDAHREVATETLRQHKKVSYTTVAGIEYLIEVANQDLKRVPASWSKISGTKKASRFHTPEVIRLIRERDQHKESLSAACDIAFQALLSSIAAHYGPLRDAISALSTLDCLLSLATVAAFPGYTKPTFLPSSPGSPTVINIEGGRHPMVEQLLPSSYIPNSTSLSNGRSEPTSPSTRALLITGPNMGGKSSYVRQVALISLLSQIGSFVPADSCSLTLLDGIYTRMGAYDSIMTSQSTFQVELSETSSILKSATSRSLVILDELGRGTSTHDGVAIAGAVLDWVVRETKCLCLFITHYQSLASVARGFEGGELRNVHMKFSAVEKEAEGAGEEEITFLYEVGDGVAHRSYGLNVARLANVPQAVLDKAALKSHELEMEVKQKKMVSLARLMNDVLAIKEGSDLQELVVCMEEL
ncbi:Mismatch repair protein msh3 [Cadophora gregata]|uniref:Mismatch repair protein msh3 n=1 Tax=Cadophora gregata TaxID=51156 RepID=UPI0026DB9127|nr:Mismatch repair protein msh3 [Cadophora gregata]KAK0119295.1 Mismatch repair protein msh3 [Cadophora gregata f. sp. sojae]KAK0126550.1 Mismatch repair protein msh3 [Cadophora gregata]